MANTEQQLAPSEDPCGGCQERQVCSVGIFVPLAKGLRPICVHPCDELETREWIEKATAALSESNDSRPVGCSSCTASVAADESGRCVPCQQAGPEHGLKTCTIHWCSEDAEVVCTHCHEAFCEAHVSGILCIECDADTTDSVGGDDA